MKNPERAAFEEWADGPWGQICMGPIVGIGERFQQGLKGRLSVAFSGGFEAGKKQPPAWTPARVKPDCDTTVLLHCPNADEPVWPGFWDGECWRYVDAGVAKGVKRWMHFPEGPEGKKPRMNTGIAVKGSEFKTMSAKTKRALAAVGKAVLKGCKETKPQGSLGLRYER